MSWARGAWELRLYWAILACANVGELLHSVLRISLPNPVVPVSRSRFDSRTKVHC